MWPFSRRDPTLAPEHRAILESLTRLRKSKAARNVFGAETHRFKLNPPLTQEAVAAFESTHRVRLPPDYRAFLLHVGSSGAGPNYGLYKSLELKETDAPHPYNESGSLVGSLSQPFPHRQAWNLSSPDELGHVESDHAPGFKQAIRPKSTEEERAEQTEREAWDTWQAQYWASHHFDGAIPLGDVGCCLLQWLVITGDEAGHVWNDFRADRRGILPLQIGSLQRVTFLQWYQSWLDSALNKAGLNQSQ